MTLRAFRALSIVATLAAIGCGELPTSSPAAVPQFAKGGGTTPTLALSVESGAGYRITSDGQGVYTSGACGVTVAFSGIDVTADILATGGKGRNACIGRTLQFTLDQPVQAGDPVWAPVSASVHIKLQELTLVVAGAARLIDGGFNQLSGVGDCSALRFNQNFGADRLLATRTLTKGVGGATRDEWTVETVSGSARAACMNAGGTAALRYYDVPAKLVITAS